jgi:hypothetical protein
MNLFVDQCRIFYLSDRLTHGLIHRILSSNPSFLFISRYVLYLLCGVGNADPGSSLLPNWPIVYVPKALTVVSHYPFYSAFTGGRDDAIVLFMFYYIFHHSSFIIHLSFSLHMSLCHPVNFIYLLVFACF